jgi:hypothetical protein
MGARQQWHLPSSTRVYFICSLKTHKTLSESVMTMLISPVLLFIVLQYACAVRALGFGKANVTETVGFVKDDNQRDTISVLISCFATLGLCVYSAVHLNVPRKGESDVRILLRELKWCIIGLFAPELILYTAWRQLASARELCYKINNTRNIGHLEQSADSKVYLP